MNRRAKLLAISVPAAAVGCVMLAAGVEIWTRWHWNERKGVPGFFLSDPVRIQRLAPGYTGWFAGVPVTINQLGFRDDREYPLEKSPATFRVLVLGDSVTFGHGSIYQHSYPYLLEQRLKGWRPDVDWQVWNVAVPGYNTSQELAHLLDVGPRFEPDLVVVGFFENDIVENFPVRSPSRFARVRSAALSWLYRHVYSIELYKRLYLQIAWTVSGENSYRQRLTHLGAEEQLIANPAQVQDLAAQYLDTVRPASGRSRRGRRLPEGASAQPRPAAGHPARAGMVRLARRGAPVPTAASRSRVLGRVLRERRAARVPR